MKELEYWTHRLAIGQISRREFLGRTAGLGAAALAGTTLLGSAALAAPKKGGFAKLATNDGSQTDSLDPATWPGSFTASCLGGALCSNLTELMPDRSVAGDLAESFESSDTSKKWVFKLRKGLTFHNGKSLTATDVIASYRHHMGPNSKSPAKAVLALVADIKADDPTTVVFTLSDSSPDFPYMVADYHLPIMPAKEGGGIDLSAPIGSGPFVMENLTFGTSAKMKRNPNYHKSGKPYFDEVEFLAIQDVAARTNALITGEVHFMNNCDIKTLSLLKRNPDISVLSTTSTRHFSFDMNTQVAPYNNPDVRLALKYAIDRQEILNKVFFGTAALANDNNVASSLKFAVDPKPQYAYDLDKAKFHLKKAGMEAVTVDLSVSEAAFPGAPNAALLFKDQAAKAGITVNVIREADDGYWSKIWRQKPFTGVDWYGRATIDWLYSTTLARDAAWNDTKFQNDHFNDLLLQARRETDDAKRAAIYAEMQQIVHDDGGMIIVAFANYINAASSKLGHGEIGGIFPLDNTKLAERWWMA
ncbi:MAG: ABC transporter substrate-binding protein [Alphaproteobacteria bacterium]|nr:ABC transporter substrate-binding protein [Alphaproteobacteria bacterium]